MLNLLIENEEIRLRAIATNIAIATITLDPKTNRHTLFTANIKGNIQVTSLLEGTTVKISVDKSKESNDKAA